MSGLTRLFGEDGSRLKVNKVNHNGYMFSTRKNKTVFEGNVQPDAVVIIAQDEQGRELIIREFRPVIDKYVYARPAGMIDAGETPQEAAIREIKEETGLDLDVSNGTMYTQTYVSPGWTDELVAIVTGTVRGTISNKYLHGDEDIQAFLMDPDDMVRHGLDKPETPISIWLAISLL